jgi:tRNA(Ile)-lysidine synthase
VSGPAPAVAACRLAVRRSLAGLAPSATVGVALSGGPDSLALMAAAAFERMHVVALVVDQAWSADSRAVCQGAAALARGLGADAVVLDGPAPREEAAARDARYAALAAAADHRGLAAVLVGHTRDDQAETVLLGLARGSGARSLAGMAPVRGIYRRPLLGLDRATTVAACTAQGLTPYADPANADPAFTRSRVRAAMGTLAAALGRDVTTGLATSARLLRDDADLLDRLADEVADPWDVAVLAALPPALRSRLLHRLATGLTAVHVEALDALVPRWHGQGPVGLPGGVEAVRRSGRIAVVPVAESAQGPA